MKTKKAREMEAIMLETLAGLVKERLTDIYDGRIKFDPVIVENKTDFYGEDYLHIYVVFDGDVNLFKSKRPPVLAWLIDPELDEFGVEKTPSHSYSKKSEWDELIAAGSREA